MITVSFCCDCCSSAIFLHKMDPGNCNQILVLLLVLQLGLHGKNAFSVNSAVGIWSSFDLL